MEEKCLADRAQFVQAVEIFQYSIDKDFYSAVYRFEIFQAFEIEQRRIVVNQHISRNGSDTVQPGQMLHRCSLNLQTSYVAQIGHTTQARLAGIALNNQIATDRVEAAEAVQILQLVVSHYYQVASDRLEVRPD